MEVFSLVAKLTLDTEEYEKALNQAESEAHNMDDPESPSLGLDTSEFDSKIAEAEEVDVDDPDEPELDLDKEPFDKTVEDAESVDVDDPETPTLDLDNQPYTDSLKDAESETSLFEGSVGDILDGIKGLIAGAGIAAAVAGVVTTLSEAVDLARSMGDNIDKSSRAMSLSTDAYQEWSHVLDINGASITDLNRGLMNMRKLMGGGDAPKEFTEAMVQLGLATEDAEGNITSQFSSTEEMLKAAMKALADFDTSTEAKLAQRDYLAQAIFGRGGTKLNAMFDGTSKDIDDLIKQAHELGLVMTEEEVANAAAYNDAVTNLHASWDALKTSLVQEIIPVLTNVFNQAAKVFALFNWRGEKDGLTNTFAEIDEKGADAILTMKENEATAMALIDKLASMGDYWTLDDTGKKTFDQLAAELIQMYPQLDQVIDENKNAIYENTEAIKANIQEWTNLEKQRILAQSLADKRTAIAQQYADAVEKEAQADIKEAQAVGKKETAYAALEKYFTTGKGQSYSDYLASLGFTGTMTDEIYNKLGGGWIETLLSESGFKDSDTSKALSAWKDLESEAETLRVEAQKMNEEADQALADLDAYEAILTEKMGMATEAEGETTAGAKTATEAVEGLGKAVEGLPDGKTVTLSVQTVWGNLMDLFRPKSKGDWSVPWDNYPALLHRGERVLTASQARQDNYSSSGSDAVVGAISGLRNDLQQLQLVVNGKTFGRAVVDYGGSRINDYLGGSDSRLDAGYGT